MHTEQSLAASVQHGAHNVESTHHTMAERSKTEQSTLVKRYAREKYVSGCSTCLFMTIIGVSNPQHGNVPLQDIQKLLQLLNRGCSIQLAPPGICQPQQQLQPGIHNVQRHYGVTLQLATNFQHTCKHKCMFRYNSMCYLLSALGNLWPGAASLKDLFHTLQGAYFDSLTATVSSRRHTEGHRVGFDVNACCQY